MAVQGVFASDQDIVGNRRLDFAAQLLQIMPEGTAPLFALTSGMESADAHDVIINWFEENHIAGRIKVTAFSTDGDGTGLVVDDASVITPNIILLNEVSGEYLLVTAVNVSSNTLTVTRNITNTGAVTITVNSHLQRIGTAYEEGSSKPTSMTNLGYVVSNYLQIFRNSWDVTGTAQAVDYYTGSRVAKSVADAALFHSEDMERSMWWGKKAIGTLNGKPFRVADGMYSFIKTNVVAASGTTTYKNLDDFYRGIFSKNIKGKPNERIAFTGNLGLSVMNDIALLNSRMNISPGQTDFGMKVSTWITPYGTVKLMTHPLFTESPFRTGDLAVLHPGAMRTRYLRRTNIDNNDKNGTRAGADADFGVYTTEVSWEYRAEVTGGLFTNIQSAA